ncbi:MAG TPA: GAF domain-containing protein, partial [Sediminispirochaeta sp.]|nr:GAF domain-containing protein [Sediminispirochaeta sp.]
MRKKTFDLLCNVGELAGLFQKSTNIKGLLHLTVKIISKHMQTEACSIFLIEKDTGDLILRATVGLNPDMIGELRLKEGDGITGTSLKSGKPICVPRGSEDPHFMYVPDIFEDKYESFLAVPIIQSGNKLGVIVLEDSRPDYYNKRDIRALSAIASQLASFLENARTLIDLRKSDHRKKRGKTSELRAFFRGQSTSPGIAIGQAVAISSDGDSGLLLQLDTREYRDSLKDFDRAVKKSISQLQEMQAHMEDQLSEAGSLIFSSHLLMLSDEDFSGSMRKMIQKGTSPAEAVVKVVNEYIKLFVNSENRNIQDKIHDIKDIGHRLLRNLLRKQDEEGDYSGQIVVARNLLPSELVKLAAQNTEGLVVYGAGETSHISILARSLEIPVVLITDSDIFDSVDGKFMIMDAFQGTLMIDPDGEVVERYVTLQEEMEGQK